MVEISLSGSGEGSGWGLGLVTAPGYSTAAFSEDVCVSVHDERSHAAPSAPNRGDFKLCSVTQAAPQGERVGFSAQVRAGGQTGCSTSSSSGSCRSRVRQIAYQYPNPRVASDRNHKKIPCLPAS